MKRFLLSCCLALGIGANAQMNFTGDFENADIAGYIQFGGGTMTAAAACTGALGGQLATNATTSQTGWGVKPEYYGQVNNNQKTTVSVSYKKASGPVGTLYLAMFSQAPGATLWDLALIKSVNLTSAAVTTCNTTTLSAVIPAGMMPQDGTQYAFGAFYARTSGSGNIYLDDIRVIQENAQPTTCNSITAPVSGSTISYGGTTISWTTVPYASKYTLTVGTTSGGSEIYSGDFGTGTTSYSVQTTPNTTYYAKVVPSNDEFGPATGCSEISFQTNSTIAYCPAGAAQANYEKITSVNFAGINNTSSAVSTAPGYEDFTSIVGQVNRGSSYTFTAGCSVTTYASDQILVWIDYNQNGSFNDPGELVLDKTGLAANWTGNVDIPASAMLGQTRMRVRVHDTSSGANATSCGNSTYGQVEDYTINVNDVPLAVSTSTKNAVTVFPNPFKDILRISDVQNVKSISVSDVSGRQVKTLAPAAELNLSSLKSGMYIVTLHLNDGSVKSIKTIKE